MLRKAEDEFMALQTINAMEKAGAKVLTLTLDGYAQYEGALIPHAKYTVWAQVENDAHIDKIDEAIAQEIDA
jgi:hypothetical protein